MIQVNVWQLGYSRYIDYLESNLQALKCKRKGKVLIDDEKAEYWESEAWELLNWSCWTDSKPDNVKSPLCYCNSDVIFQIDGTTEFVAVLPIGYYTANTLEYAIEVLKEKGHFYPFISVRRQGGSYMRKHNKWYYRKNDNSIEEEVTW